MATAKRKTKTVNRDPFTTKKTSSKKKVDRETLDPKDSIKSAVDDFVAAAIKESEGKAEKIAPKDTVEGSFARLAFAERFCSGKEDSFYIKGNENQVIFIHQDKSDISSEDELADIADKWGEGALELFEKDYSSVKINGKFLKENWDSLIPRLLDALGDDFGELFSEVKYTGVKNITQKARDFVDGDPTKFEDFIRDCKIRSFIKK